MTSDSTTTRLVALALALAVITVGGVATMGVAAQDNETTDNETDVDVGGNETVDNETDVGLADNETMDNETMDNETVGITDNETMAMPTASVSIEDQTSNGSAINVSSANLSEGGFVVAYNTTLAEPLGSVNATNASMNETMAAGQNETANATNATNDTLTVTGNETMAAGQNLTLMLDESLDENQTIVVVAFQDTNDNGQFDLGTDEVYMNENGSIASDFAMVNLTDTAAVTEEETETNETEDAGAEPGQEGEGLVDPGFIDNNETDDNATGENVTVATPVPDDNATNSSE